MDQDPCQHKKRAMNILQFYTQANPIKKFEFIVDLLIDRKSLIQNNLIRGLRLKTLKRVAQRSGPRSDIL